MCATVLLNERKTAKYMLRYNGDWYCFSRLMDLYGWLDDEVGKNKYTIQFNYYDDWR